MIATIKNFLHSTAGSSAGEGGTLAGSGEFGEEDGSHIAHVPGGHQGRNLL